MCINQNTCGRIEMESFKFSLIWTVLLFLLSGCADKQVDIPRLQPSAEQQRIEHKDDLKEQAYRARSPIPLKENRYEGSLWEDEASWGNLLRDHRARFRGDLVKITKLQEVISLPEIKEQPPPQPLTPLAEEGEEEAEQAKKVVEAVTGVSKAEREQREVLASLDSISAYVQSVLPNGNMVIVGEKVDYRQQNTIRYVTTIKGIIRPADVNEDNEIPAVKLARFEPKIKRQMLAKNLLNLAPVIGTQKAGLLDRLSHVVAPSSSGESQPVNTQSN